MRVLKLVGLFLGYALVGLGGDYAMSLLAQEHSPAHGVRVHVNDVKVERAVRVRTRGRASTPIRSCSSICSCRCSLSCITPTSIS